MPRPSNHRSALIAVVTAFIGISACPCFADDVAPWNATAIRQQIDQRLRDKQQAEKELTLRQGAVAVAEQRLSEIQKQLEQAQARVSAEKAEAQKIEQKTTAMAQELAKLTETLPAHEAADSLIARADQASARLEALQSARQKLQNDLSALRKSAVEWRSKVTDSDQQIAAITAQRPELDKKLNEARTAADAATAMVAATQKAVTESQTMLETAASALVTNESQLKDASESVQKLNTSIASVEKSLATLRDAAKLTGVDASASLQGLEKALSDLKPMKASIEQLVTQLTTRRDEQSKLLASVKAEFDKKTAEHQTSVSAAAPVLASFKAAGDAIATASAREASLKVVKADGEMWQTTLQAQLVGLEPSLQKLSAEMQIVEHDALVTRREAENALEPLGRFVSFSRHVAPILADRCIACHNTRSPGGRLNLDSFAAMMKGGESGAALTARKSHESLMLMMVKDGSMPKDADPLKPEEIAVIQKWIDVGAPIDAGIPVTADLFDVMPERSQPEAPPEYRVAIPVTAVTFNHDGSQLASSGYHEVLIWNTADGSLIRRISNVAERVYDLEFSNDGSTLAVAAGTPGQLGELKLFSAADGSLVRTLVRSRDAVFALAFSPDGQHIASAGADRSIVVSDLADGAEVTRIEDHADWVMDINWSPNGQRLVSSSRDKTSKVFEATTGNPVITFPNHGEPVYTAAFLADGATVVSGGGDKRIRVWNSADAKEVRAIGGFGGDVFRIEVQPGDVIVSAPGDLLVQQNNAAHGAEVPRLAGHNDWVYTLSITPDQKRIASGSYDGEIRLWNAEDGTMVSSFLAMPRGQQAVAAAAAQP
ncbi:MAG: c-type cytochrome domain-containing protein [Planctomycetota bacterium]